MPWAYYLRGLLLHEMGKTTEAISDLEQATSLDANNFRYYYNLANMYFRSSGFNKAESTVVECLKIDPTSQEALQLLKLIQQNRQ